MELPEQLMRNFDYRHMEMLRAILPYIPLSMQKFLKIYIGFEELSNALQTIRNSALQPAVGNSSSAVTDTKDLLQVLRGFCTPKENETINMVLNMTQMMNLYDQYKTLIPAFPEPSGQQPSGQQPSPPLPGSMDLFQKMSSWNNNSEIDNIFKDYENE